MTTSPDGVEMAYALGLRMLGGSVTGGDCSILSCRPTPRPRQLQKPKPWQEQALADLQGHTPFCLSICIIMAFQLLYTELVVTSKPFSSLRRNLSCCFLPMLSSREASVASREGEEGDNEVEGVGIGMQGYAVLIADGLNLSRSWCVTE